MRAIILAVLLTLATSASAQQVYRPYYGAGGFSYQPVYIGPSYAIAPRAVYVPRVYGGFYGGGWGRNTRAWMAMETVNELRGIRYAIEDRR